MESSSKSILAVAIIGLVGTLGAAVIANWDKLFGRSSPVTAAPAGTGLVGPAAGEIVAPHAPPIELGQSTTVWGEETKLIVLAAGEKKTLDARDLYADIATFPKSSCLGPGYIVYTWQVRAPYPEGGDLEIRSVLQGGSTDQVALGAMGRATMSPCGQHVFKNNGLQRMQLELRYATAVDKKVP